ncbi:hypothetical protein MZE84_24905 [Escherichia coli]|uniref:hypothetical protein n=2 Tax=Escherichia coli TaxID=562 RepID=UPI0012FFB8A5|nr:hypothetical protein [Escherichia coli]ELP5229293.1 hypothetical protein [Escherichia coli]MCK2402975.1 hypothetical protein [Escherichia coli]MCK2466648.1 hypothetical protein [Escherichia coli]MCK2488464.1 hypothetical protein [Escherichia coli]MCK2648382.1 hypothetical protein [Escherichia coli]
MNSNRYLCQEFIEVEVGCLNPANLSSFKNQIENYSLPSDKVSILNESMVSDAKDVFFKSSLSLLEALFSLKRGHSSWAIVKLYYSIFYSLRTYLLLNGYAIFKNGNGGIYFIRCESDSTPVCISTRKIRGDHKTTIKAFCDFFPNHKLNTNTIDSESIFDWAMRCRENVNYRSSSFIEPDYGYEAIPNLRGGRSQLDILVRSYINDPYYTYCFVKEHSLLATAFVLSYEIVSIFRHQNILFLSDERRTVIHNLLKRSGLLSFKDMVDLFCNNRDVLPLEV